MVVVGEGVGAAAARFEPLPSVVGFVRPPPSPFEPRGFTPGAPDFLPLSKDVQVWSLMSFTFGEKLSPGAWGWCECMGWSLVGTDWFLRCVPPYGCNGVIFHAFWNRKGLGGEVRLNVLCPRPCKSIGHIFFKFLKQTCRVSELEGEGKIDVNLSYNFGQLFQHPTTILPSYLFPLEKVRVLGCVCVCVYQRLKIICAWHDCPFKVPPCAPLTGEG